MATKKKKGERQKYPSSRAIVPDVKSLKMKILRANFIAHCMINCTENDYIPLDPAKYGWSWDIIELSWKPIWYEGNPLLMSEDLQESDSDCNVDTDDDSDYVVSDDALSDSDAD